MIQGVIKIRDVLPIEGIQCQVGNGECTMLACELHDNGIGGTFAVCRSHLAHVYYFTEMIMNMGVAQSDQLEATIEEVEQLPLN